MMKPYKYVEKVCLSKMPIRSITFDPYRITSCCSNKNDIIKNPDPLSTTTRAISSAKSLIFTWKQTAFFKIITTVRAGIFSSAAFTSSILVNYVTQYFYEH